MLNLEESNNQSLKYPSFNQQVVKIQFNQQVVKIQFNQQVVKIQFNQQVVMIQFSVSLMILFTKYTTQSTKNKTLKTTVHVLFSQINLHYTTLNLIIFKNCGKW